MIARADNARPVKWTYREFDSHYALIFDGQAWAITYSKENSKAFHDFVRLTGATKVDGGAQ
jgi:hypothetical protein